MKVIHFPSGPWTDEETRISSADLNSYESRYWANLPSPENDGPSASRFRVSVPLDEVPAAPAVTKEHAWLKQFVGQWETTMEATVPGQPATECKGTITSKAIGSYWVVNEMKSEMMGMPMIGQQTLGYDTKTKKYRPFQKFCDSC